MRSGASVNLVIANVRISKLIKNQSHVVGIRFDKKIGLCGRTLPGTRPGSVSLPLSRPVHFKGLAAIWPHLGQLWKAADGPIDQSIAVRKALNISHIKREDARRRR